MYGFFLQLVAGNMLQSNGNDEFSQANLTSEKARNELKQFFRESETAYKTNIHRKLNLEMRKPLYSYPKA